MVEIILTLSILIIITLIFREKTAAIIGGTVYGCEMTMGKGGLSCLKKYHCQEQIIMNGSV